MELTNIRVEVSGEVTVNLGNFENFKPGYRLSADVPKDSTPDEARAALREILDKWLEQDYVEAKADLKVK